MTIFTAFKAKYRLGRYFVWLGACCLISLIFVIMPLWLIFHPPTWVLYVSAVALSLAMPDPKWVRR